MDAFSPALSPPSFLPFLLLSLLCLRPNGVTFLFAEPADRRRRKEGRKGGREKGREGGRGLGEGEKVSKLFAVVMDEGGREGGREGGKEGRREGGEDRDERPLPLRGSMRVSEEEGGK